MDFVSIYWQGKDGAGNSERVSIDHLQDRMKAILDASGSIRSVSTAELAVKLPVSQELR